MVIAGASGYVGHALIEKLLGSSVEVEIIALSRTSRESDDPRVTWRACDLFSLKSLEEAVPDDVDFAYYLVHSMGPTAKLDQGSFSDYDLLLADNFVRRLKKSQVQRLIYLGGLLPENESLSLHLQSRLEVEDTFLTSGIPVTVFRAGLIIGEHGSSFQILSKLVNRLPIMICPRWTQTLTTPVGIDEVTDALTSVLRENSNRNESFDLAGCEPLSYVDMMRTTAKAMGKRRLFLTVPLFTPTLSRLWVRLITGVPKELVYPLVESLEHRMVARPSHLFHQPTQGTTYASLLRNIDFKVAETERPKKRLPVQVRRKTVRSVQRFPLPEGRDAAWAMDEYAKWLTRSLFPFVKVLPEGEHVYFCFFSRRHVLLDLTRHPTRSSSSRQLLYVRGGALAARNNRGRLEFREVLGRQYLLAALHEFRPAIPWFLYRLTQSLAHVYVMAKFASYLKSQASRTSNGPRAVEGSTGLRF